MAKDKKTRMGDDNTVVGRIPGGTRMGSGNTIVCATDTHGNTLLNQGGRAIGRDAHADSTSIAIGAGAGAGAHAPVVKVLESLKGAVEGAGTDQHLQNAALEALKALQNEARQPATERANRSRLKEYLKKVVDVVGLGANLVAIAAFFGVNME